MTASWFAAAIIAVILGVLLIASRVLAKVGAFLLVAGLVVVAALVAVASAHQARATQAAATAAAVASGGQTLATAAIVFLVVVLALAGLAGYLYLASAARNPGRAGRPDRTLSGGGSERSRPPRSAAATLPRHCRTLSCWKPCAPCGTCGSHQHSPRRRSDRTRRGRERKWKMFWRFLTKIGGGSVAGIGVALIILALLVASCATTPTAIPSPEDGDVYLTWAAANLRAQSAQETAQAAALRVTQQAQLTAQARNEYWFRVTQTAVAWTQEAQRAQATAVAATASARATETAIWYARETAVAAQTATAVAPTIALTQKQLETDLEREEWRQATVPIEHILRLIFWLALIALAVATLVWAIPKAYYAVMFLILRSRSGAPDKAVAYILAAPGFFGGWANPPRLTAYDPDRDEGPGQVVDPATGEARRLPGGSPETARQDQVVDALTRPAAVSGGRFSSGVTAQAARALQPPAYRILPPDSPPPAPIAAALPALDAQWQEMEGKDAD